VVFGPCFLSPAYCGRLEDGSTDDGYDFLVGFQNDEDGNSMSVRVEAVYSDTDASNPGLELLTGWDTAPGTPTYVSGSTFTVTGDQTQWYVGGMPLRLVTTANAGAWLYVAVSATTLPSYASGTGLTTITITGGTLDSGMNTGGNVTGLAATPTAGGTGYTLGDVLTITTGGSSATAVVTRVAAGVVTAVALQHPGEGYTTGTAKATSGGTGSSCTLNITAIDGGQMATEYLTENSRYTSGTEDLLSVRTFVPLSGGMVIQANSSMTNIATVIKEILRNTTWGLGVAVDATSFATAAADVATAGLTCSAAALGGDRQQRRAGEVIRELLMLIGGRLNFNPADSEWEITTDLTAPAAAAVTFGLTSADTYANIIRVESNKKSSLSEAISVLHLKFGSAGRVKNSTDTGTVYAPGNYQFDIEATILGVGHEEFITTPWIRTIAGAVRVLARIAKQMRFGDRKPTILVGQEGRNVTVGQLVHYENSLDGINADFRVLRIERRLTDTKLELAGYDASIYAYTATDTTICNDILDPDELAAQRAAGTGNNLIVNSDFSAGLNSAALGEYSLPGWRIYWPALFTSATVDVDPNYVGGAALVLVMPGGGSPPSIWPADLNSLFSIPVQPSTLYIFSVYSDSQVWSVSFWWSKTNGAQCSPAFTDMKWHVDPSDVNGKGWKRYYAVSRSPSTAAYCWPVLTFPATAITVRLDAVQLEEALAAQGPSFWKRHAKWGVDPVLVQPGDLTVRAAGETAHGTSITHNKVELDLSISTTATDLIPAGAQAYVTAFITEQIVGPTSIKIGWSGDVNAWAEGMDLTVGTVNSGGVYPNAVKISDSAATSVVVTGEGGAITAGKIKLTAHCFRFIPPTA
jgi:hypothetical protein